MDSADRFIEDAISSFRSSAKMDKTVTDYQELVGIAQDDDGFSSAEFKSKFTKFYVLRRNDGFRELFYDYLAQNEGNDDLEIEEVIEYLRKAPGNIELSFASKLLSMVSEDNPIWDANVETVLKKVRSDQMGEIAKMKLDPLKAASKKYQLLRAFYEDLHESGYAKRMVERFNEIYPQAEGIPDNRKIDFILWNAGADDSSRSRLGKPNQSVKQ